MRNILLAAVAATILSSSTALAAESSPKTVVHVISVKWKADASPAQIQKVLDAVAQMPSQYPGITRVWTKPIKKQLPEGYSSMIVMEFSSQDALKKYVDSPAQKKFYEVYMPLREESRTSDVTN
jgi:uncharacterized protein (DUF1330 family)